MRPLSAPWTTAPVSDVAKDVLNATPVARLGDERVAPADCTTMAEVRQGVDGRGAHRPDAGSDHRQGGQHDEKAIGDGPANEGGDHCAAPPWPACPFAAAGAGGVADEAGGTAGRSPEIGRAAIPDRLASESIRN